MESKGERGTGSALRGGRGGEACATDGGRNRRRSGRTPVARDLFGVTSFVEKIASPGPGRKRSRKAPPAGKHAGAAEAKAAASRPASAARRADVKARPAPAAPKVARVKTVTKKRARKRVAKSVKKEKARPLFKLPASYDPSARLLFSFSLFVGKQKQFGRYLECCCQFLETMGRVWPKCKFVGFVCSRVADADLASMAAAAGKRPIRFVRVALPATHHGRASPARKKGSHWLVGAMRFEPLWAHRGRDTVVVCDIHDDLRLLNIQLVKNLKRLSIGKMDAKRRAAPKEDSPPAPPKEVLITFWPARQDCLHGSALPRKRCRAGVPKGGHAHTDGGLIIWKAGEARRLARALGSFASFVEDTVRRAAAIPRGIDEMILDGFLAAAAEDMGPRVLYAPHVHCMADGFTGEGKEQEPRRAPAARGGAVAVSTVTLDCGDFADSSESLFVCSEARPPKV